MKPLPDVVAAAYRHEVTADDTADRWQNDLPVLATPVLLWLGEVAAMHAIAEYLDDHEMTVGLSHDSSHLAPTPPGRAVQLTAELRHRAGRKLVFDVYGHDGVDEILRGTHTRAVVDRRKFLDRLAAKAVSPPA